MKTFKLVLPKSNCFTMFNNTNLLVIIQFIFIYSNLYTLKYIFKIKLS